MTSDSELSSTDRQSIAGLVAAYARAVDRRNYRDLGTLFTETGTIAVHKGPDVDDDPISKLTGPAEIAETIEGLHRGYRATYHFLGQHTCTANGEEATGETYCQANHIYEADGTWMNRCMHIRYQDHFVRSGPSWRFAGRKLAIDWIEIRPVGTVPVDGGWKLAKP